MLAFIYLLAVTGATANAEPDDGPIITTAAPNPAPRPPITPPPLGMRRPNPIPKGNPGVWANTNDYPAIALQKQMEGTTGFRRVVGPDGRVTDCQIVSTSGSSELDQATCSNVQRRARFDPALDATGQPVSGSYANRVRWQIPRFALTEGFPRAPFALKYGWTRLLPEDFPKSALEEKRYGTAKIELAVASNGALTSCNIVESSGHADLDDASCKVATTRTTFSPALDLLGKPTEGRIRTKLDWRVTADKPALSYANLDIFPKPYRSTSTFKVNKDGSLSDCKSEGSDISPKMDELFCSTIKRKPYLDAKGQPVARMVKVTEIVEMEDVE